MTPMKTLKKMLMVLVLAPFLFCLPPAWAENGGGAEEVLHATLENGLRVVIVRNTLAPVMTGGYGVISD
jgi:hypothetical protein